ncbi:hypothetical protein D3C84_648120 [compost metagenome]
MDFFLGHCARGSGNAERPCVNTHCTGTDNVRHQLQNGLVTCVEQLQHCRCTTALRGLGQSLETGNECIVERCKFVGESNTVGEHVRATGDHQTDTVYPTLVISNFLVGDCTVRVAGPRCHGGHRHAIAQLDSVVEHKRLEHLTRNLIHLST